MLPFATVDLQLQNIKGPKSNHSSGKHCTPNLNHIICPSNPLRICNVSGFLLGGTLLDIGVWYNVKDLQIYDKEEEKDNTKRKKQSTRDEQGKMNQVNESLVRPSL